MRSLKNTIALIFRHLSCIIYDNRGRQYYFLRRPFAGIRKPNPIQTYTLADFDLGFLYSSLKKQPLSLSLRFYLPFNRSNDSFNVSVSHSRKKGGWTSLM